MVKLHDMYVDAQSLDVGNGGLKLTVSKPHQLDTLKCGLRFGGSPPAEIPKVSLGRIRVEVCSSTSRLLNL